ncbi:MAG TPA: PE family protein [Mycobacterium sp.]|nr:PE family protein [Mycobacterium sp.]
MSFVIATPDLVESAAQNLAGVRSSLAEAAATAAGPTTGIAVAAQDEVSIAISSMFGNFGQEFQALSAQAQAFHEQFVGLLNAGAGAYLSTEAANAGQGLLGGGVLGSVGQNLGGAFAGGGTAIGQFAGNIGNGLNGAATALQNGSFGALVSAQIQVDAQAISAGVAGAPAAAPTVIQGINEFWAGVAAPYQALAANTQTNLQAIGSTIAANPFPVLNQLSINQQGYARTFFNGVALDLQGFPANVPANVQLAIQGASTFNPGALLQQFVNGQIATGQTTSTSLQNAAGDFSAGLPTFSAGVQTAFHDLLAGNPVGAYGDLNQALVNAFLPGFNSIQVAPGASGLGEFLVTPMGPLGDLGPILDIPGQMAQNFVTLLPPGSIPAQMAQNAANVIAGLTNFNTTLDILTINIPGATTATLSFGAPVQLIFGLLGAPGNALSALNSTGVALAGAVQAGNASAAAAALLDAPAFMANGFLNGTTFVTLPPTALTLLGVIPATSTVTIPLGGLLTPLSFPTAETSALGLTLPVDIVGGTPVGGLIPTMLSIDSQLARAITPIT